MPTDLFADVTEEEINTSEGIFSEQATEPVEEESPYLEETGPERYAGPRAAGDELIGMAVAAIGGIFVNRGIDPPVGRALILEAPLAGKKIDEALAHTWLDNLLQPIFRKADDFEGIGAVFALPVLVGLYERKPEWAPMLEPMMVEVIGTTLDEVAPLMRKKATARRRSARSVTEISEAFGMEIPRGANVTDMFANWIMNGGENAEEETS